MSKKLNKDNIGSNFDSFLLEEDILDEVEAVAIKRIIAFQLKQEMEKNNWSKSLLAEKMHTSRSSVDRLLDPENTAITLKTLEKLAKVLGKKLNISFA